MPAPTTRKKCKCCNKNLDNVRQRKATELWDQHLNGKCNKDWEPFTKDDVFCEKCRKSILVGRIVFMNLNLENSEDHGVIEENEDSQNAMRSQNNVCRVLNLVSCESPLNTSLHLC